MKRKKNKQFTETQVTHKDVQIQEDLTNQYKCDQCSKSFTKMFLLRKHNANWHEALNCYIFKINIQSKKEIMKHKEIAHKMRIL